MQIITFITEVPAIRFVYFDPEKEQYATAVSRAIPITVKPALAVGMGDGGLACDHGVFADARISLGEGGGDGPIFIRGDPDASGGVNITSIGWELPGLIPSWMAGGELTTA